MTDCGHGLHQKYKIQGAGFVCIGCDPTWVPVTNDDGPFSLLARLGVGTEPMTEEDWQDTEA